MQEAKKLLEEKFKSGKNRWVNGAWGRELLLLLTSSRGLKESTRAARDQGSCDAAQGKARAWGV